MAMIPAGVKSPLRRWTYNAYTNNWVQKGKGLWDGVLVRWSRACQLSGTFLVSDFECSLYR